jgi:hypothetical protein
MWTPSTNGYKNEIGTTLERQQGGGIGNQQIQLQKSVSDQAIKTGVNVSETGPSLPARILTPTNSTKNSLSRSLSNARKSQLVNFLFNVGNDPAMIRVRELHSQYRPMPTGMGSRATPS